MRIVFCSLLVLAFTSSCCKRPYEVPVLRISYPELNENKLLRVAIYKNDNFGTPQELTLGELTETNNYSQPLEVNESVIAYVVFINETSYRDSIYNIAIKRDKCEKSIESIQYKLNGVEKESKRIEILP